MDSQESQRKVATIPRITPNKRTFRGNINYVNFYNRFVLETLNSNDVTSTSYYNPRSKFKPCVLDIAGKAHYGNYSSIPGTLWSELEKERFFRALALYLIHRIDLINDFLDGKKSNEEILQYYNILKSELQRKKFGLSLNKSFNYKYTKRGEKRIIKLPRFRKSLLKYSELPIAYEMSKGFLKLEDEQSEFITMKERARLNDQQRHFSKSWKEYVEEQKVNLLEIDNLQEIVTRVYSQQNIVDGATTPRFLPKLEMKSVVFLEELIKNVTARIVLAVIENKMAGDLLASQRVTKFDIEQSIRQLKYKDDLFNWNKYWSGLSKRLNIEVIDDMTNGRLMDHEEVKQYIEGHISLRRSKYPWMVKPAEEDFKVVHSDPFTEDTHERNSNKPLKISNMARSKVDWEDQSDYEEVVLELTGLETSTLEISDKTELRSYEHGLVAYLSQGDIKIHSPEESAEIVEMWEEDEIEKKKYLRIHVNKQKRKRTEYEIIKNLKLAEPEREDPDDLDDGLDVLEESLDILDEDLDEITDDEMDDEYETKQLEEGTLLSTGLINYYNCAFADY